MGRPEFGILKQVCFCIDRVCTFEWGPALAAQVQKQGTEHKDSVFLLERSENHVLEVKENYWFVFIFFF